MTEEKQMTQAKIGSTVTISYIGTLNDGTIFSSTEELGPVTATIGAEQLFPALERAIMDMRVGETRNIQLSAEECYGPRRQENIVTVARSTFPAGKEIVVGRKLSVDFAGGTSRVMVVQAVNESEVTLDGNHVLAGFELTFALRLDEVA